MRSSAAAARPSQFARFLAAMLLHRPLRLNRALPRARPGARCMPLPRRPSMPTAAMLTDARGMAWTMRASLLR
eukprot:scaffold23830_cov28-Tisochrysis_lutea.AAC.4